MNTDPKVRKIIEWRESFSTLPDPLFFELVHMYLGKVKTPYNKQKLAEEIGAFLRKEETRKMLVRLLSETDIKILTAIKFIDRPDISKLEALFVPLVPQGTFYTLIESLEERLVIFSVQDANSGKRIIRLNPYLEEDIEPLLSFSSLIAPEKSSAAEPVSRLRISPEVCAVFISFIFNNPGLCKSNGELKSKSVSALELIFKGSFSKPFFETLFKGMKNLCLLREHADTKEFSVDWDSLSQFASLPFVQQEAYLCAACASQLFSRSMILSGAKLFLETVSFIGSSVYTRKKILGISFFLKEHLFSGGFRRTRFSRMIFEEQENSAEDSFMEAMIDAAVSLGILNAKTEHGTEFLSAALHSDEGRAALDKSVSIDAGCYVTVMPGLSLKELVPFAQFLTAVRCDVAVTFEITRQSVMKGFDAGMTKEQIAGCLREHSAYDVPQSILVSLEEWASAYDSVSLFKGYVLKIDPQQFSYLEKNQLFKKHVRETLAPGIYLLDFVLDSEASHFLEKLGIDCAGTVRQVKNEAAALGFPEIRLMDNSALSKEKESRCEPGFRLSSKEEQNAILDGFRERLAQLQLTAEQKSGLEDRINRRIVLTEEQLRPESVTFELMEADGMNFTGKMHILESAVKNGDFVEIEMTGTKENFIGAPKSVLKNSESPVLVIARKKTDSDETEECTVIIALIAKVRKIRSATSLLHIR